MDSCAGVLCLMVIFGNLLAAAEVVVFDKEELTVVDPSTLSASDQTEYADPTSCGSKLYKKSVEASKNLALNIRVTDFAKNDYFRAHPSFISCLQKVFTKTYALTSSRIKLEKGYEPESVAGTGTDDVSLYKRSGCGALLKYKSGSTDLKKIAEAALTVCPMIFEAVQRDIGIEIQSDAVFIYMVGDLHSGGNRITGLTQTETDSYINKGLVPLKTPDCSSYTQLNQGENFPSDASNPTDVVGEVDEAITKSMDTDFRRLVQYLGTDVDFLDDEGIGCSVRYIANDVTNRCDDRVMSARMYNVIVRLKHFVSNSGSLGGRIQIDEAWDDGTGNPNTLHTEGRAVKLTYPSGNTAANLKLISQLAICAKADYVEHKSDHIFLAVKKQKGRVESSVTFARATLISVEPPASKAAVYALPDQMKDEEDEYPLHDSNGRLDTMLNENASVSLFVAKDPQYRYFRLHPAIVRCYSKLVYHVNKHLTEYDSPVNIEIIRAFMSNAEQDFVIQFGDMKYNTHTLGQALELKYSNATDNHTLEHLLKNVIDVCAPEFDLDGSDMKVGLLSKSVFVAMDDTFSFWAQLQDSIPSGYTEETYEALLDERKTHAIMGRIVDPDDMDEVCNKPEVPVKQNILYTYDEPLIYERRRRRRRSTSASCTPSDDTDFCRQTLVHREKVANDLWKEINKKHVYSYPENLKSALDGCFTYCGTCLEGYVYEAKIANCTNFLHWVPFDLMNTAANYTNFYSRDNADTEVYACADGRHCIILTPLFSQIASGIKLLYRPDPERGVKEALYSSEDNPSPLLSLLEEMYGMNAQGIVYFWVQDDKEMTSMKLPLRSVMLYNKNVTSIVIYVTDTMSIAPVEGVVEGYVKEWATTGCPTYTREILTPFTVQGVPSASRKRRSAERPRMDFDLMRSMGNPDAFFKNQEP